MLVALVLLIGACQSENKPPLTNKGGMAMKRQQPVLGRGIQDTIKPVVPTPGASLPHLDPVPVPSNPNQEYRLVVRLQYVQSSDVGSLNTHDEIQLFWRGLESFNEVKSIHRDIVPTEDRDVYEFGKNANDTLRALLFQGPIRPTNKTTKAQHLVTASLTINEQDNAQFPALEQLAASAGEAGVTFFSSKMAQTAVTGPVMDQVAKDFKSGIGSLYNSFKNNAKSPLGTIAIMLRRNGVEPELLTSGALGTEQRIDPPGINDNDVTYRIRQGQAEYLVRLFLEKLPTNPAPIQRTVFLRESNEQCSKDVLLIQTIDGATKLKRGETKRFYVPKEKFWWYCENALGESDLKAYYIEAMKELNGSNLRLRGFRIEEDVAGAQQNGLSRVITSRGVLPPNKGRKHLEETHDACNDNVLMVQSIDGSVAIGKGESKLVRVPSNRIWWYCGGSREWTTAPVGTNLVFVTRSLGGAFTWTCYQETTPPPRPMRFLGNTHDACNDNTLTIQSWKGTVGIAKGKSAGFFVPGRTIWWYCGGAREETTLPEGANYVIVTRSNGGAFTWDYYKHNAPPTGSLAFQGNTHEASNEPVLLVQTSTGSISISKGETKVFHIPRNTFWWYSGVEREWTTAPTGCNLVVMTRAATGGALSFACYKDNSLTSRLVYKGNTNDMCSENFLGIAGLGQTIQIAKGQTKSFYVYSNRVEWICGSSREAVSLPPGTNFVYVTRSITGGAFTWECYYDSRQKALEFLGTETDACGENSLSLFDRNGNKVYFSKGGVKDIFISRREINWYCGGSQEASVLPPGTNYISVARESDGRKIWWNCYRAY